jgi:hypothetical protein
MVEYPVRFMREPHMTVVYTMKNANGEEVVLKKDCPESHAVHAYESLKELAEKIKASESEN